MVENQTKDIIIHVRFPNEFLPIWNKFKLLAKKDEKLLEVNHLSQSKKAKPIPVVIRNLIENYVEQNKIKQVEHETAG